MNRFILLITTVLVSIVYSFAQQSINDLELYAKSGDATSMRKLGECYLKGDGIEKNERLGFEWLNRAALLGDAEAKQIMGEYKKNDEKTSDSGIKDERVRSLAYDIEHGNFAAERSMRDLALGGNMEALVYMYGKKMIQPNDAVVLAENYERGEKGFEKDLRVASLLYWWAMNWANDVSLSPEYKKRMCEGLFRLFDEGWGLSTGIFENGIDIKTIISLAKKDDTGKYFYILGYYYYRMCLIYHFIYDEKTICSKSTDCLTYLMAAKKQGNTDAMILLADILDTPIENNDWMGLGKAIADGKLTSDGQPIKKLSSLPMNYPSMEYSGSEYKEFLNDYISDIAFSCYREAAIKGDIRGIIAMGDKYYNLIDSEHRSSWYGNNNESYTMAKQWYMKGVSMGSQEATDKLVKIVKDNWYYGEEQKKYPDQEVIEFLKHLTEGNDSKAVKPIVAAGALSDIYFYIWQVLHEATPGLPDPMMSDAYENVFTYSLMVANANDGQTYSQILSDSEYRIGILKSKGDLQSRKSAITWFDKAISHCTDSAKQQKIAYERERTQISIEQ